MAADLTTISVEVPGASAPNTLIKTTALRLDLSLNSLGTGTSQIWEVPVGHALISGQGIVHTACASDGDATLTFAVVDDISTAIPVLSLAAGDVFDFGCHTKIGGGTVDAGTYAVAVATDLTMTVATATFTAGVIYLVLQTVDVAALHASSILVGDGLV